MNKMLTNKRISVKVRKIVLHCCNRTNIAVWLCNFDSLAKDDNEFGRKKYVVLEKGSEKNPGHSEK